MAADLQFDRFPRPEFSGDYQLPQTQTPLPREDWWLYVDVGLLALALAVSALAVFRFPRLGRRIQVVNAGWCLLYFGFLRKGCICPVGSVQNIVNSLFDPSYLLPLLAVAFFGLPILAALFRGRVFCGSVCPFGGLQELVNVRPRRVPALLDRMLGLVPPIFLATTVLAALTGLGYLICRIDPFVGIFRWGASLPVAVFAVGLLGVGVFFNRPYCRWICPYGWLLGTAALCAGKPLSLAKPECTSCGLCAKACRVDAISLPPKLPGRVVPDAPSASDDPEGVPGPQRAAPWLGLFLAVGLVAGLAVGPFIASLHPDSRLMTALAAEDAGTVPTGSLPETLAFRSSGQPLDEMAAQARLAALKIRIASTVWGAACALVLFGAWWRVRQARQPVAWAIDPRRCVACGRCLDACPLSRAKPQGVPR